MHKIIFIVVMAFGLLASADKTPVYQLALVRLDGKSISFRSDLTVPKYPAMISSSSLDQGMKHIALAYSTKDRGIAVLNLDASPMLEPRDLLSLTEKPALQNELILTADARKNSVLGQWRDKPRLLLVPMLKSKSDAQNMVISAKGATVVVKDDKHMSIELQEADSKALSFKIGEFHLDPVSVKEFLKGWERFIDQEEPNGFVTFYNAGQPTSVAAKFTLGEEKGSTVTLDFKVLNGENTQQLAEDLKTARGLVVFVDQFGGSRLPA